MEHIEQAGVHPGDSACSLPAYTLSQEIQDVMRSQVQTQALKLEVDGPSDVEDGGNTHRSVPHAIKPLAESAA
ncbi:carbamoyl-phosphate synthase large subunit [Escherichia coli]|nr:carbamoyl-phosphate synthase large subunit [Escherichia coli]